MTRRLWVGVGVLVGVIAFGPARGAADLTGTERTWLESALPVLVFAREQGLPLDIIVQPQPTPGETSLGMAYVDRRCKLVFSMRGNPEAQATLDRIPQGLLGPVVEAIAAHELAHCWRHVRQSWGTVPAGIGSMPAAGRLTPEGGRLGCWCCRSSSLESWAAWFPTSWPESFRMGR